MTIITQRGATCMRMTAIAALLALWIVPALALAGTGMAKPAAQAATDTVEVTDQPLQNGSVTIQRIVATKAGWMAIHKDNGGKPGPVIGYSAVKSGENTGVAVKLSENVPANGKLWAMLHIDAGTIGTYEFPGPDAPALKSNGDIVMTAFTITQGAAPAASPAPAASTPSGLPNTGAGTPAPVVWLTVVALLFIGVGSWVLARPFRRR